MRLLSSSGCYDGRYIWLSSDQINAVYRVDTQKAYKLEYVCQFEESAWGNGGRIIELFYLKGHVYFVSSEGYEIWDMDTKTLKMNHCLLINQPYKNSAVCCLENDCIWIIPRSFDDPIVSFNVSTNSISQYDSIEEKWGGLDSGAITNVVSLNHNFFFVTRELSNIHLFILDCSQTTGKTINTKTVALDQYESASCIFVDKDCVGVLGKTKKGTTSIFMYDSNGNLVKCVDCPEVYYPDNFEGIPYSDVLHINHSFFIFPYHMQDFYVYHEYMGRTEKILLPESAQKTLCGDVTRVSRIWCRDSRILCLSQSMPGVLFIELNKLEWIPFDIDKDSLDDSFVEQLMAFYSTGREKEGELLSLSEYIEFIGR